MFTGISQAGIISYDQFTSATTIGNLNTAVNRVYNEFNGSITSENIANGTITSSDIIASSNPIVRDGELIGDMVYTGLLPVTSTDLISNISAGTCYINGNRIVKDATAKTYTASKDTWVFIDQNGAFSYSPVNNGAAQPDTPTNSILLAKVVTDTDNITSVTDYRQLTPSNLRIYQDYIQGCVLSRDAATATKISIDVGEIELGNTAGKVRRNIAPVYVDLSTTGRGALDTGTLAAGYYYFHAISDDANSTNFEAIGSTSRTSPTGYSGTRLIGWCYANSASVISVDAIGSYRAKGGDAPNLYASGQSGLSVALGTRKHISLHTAKFYSSGRPVKIDYQANGTITNGTADLTLEVSKDTSQITGSLIADSGSSTGTVYANPSGHIILRDISVGEHNIDLVVTDLDDADAWTIKGWSLMIEEL